MILRAGYILLAQRLQESADSASHSGVREHLADAVRDAHRGTGKYAHYMDHTGDGKSGDVIYSVDGDTMSAPYTISSTGSKQTAQIGTDKASKVIASVSYKKQVNASEAAAGTQGQDLRIVESYDFNDDLRLAESLAGGVEKTVKIIAPGKGSSAFYTAEVLKRDGPKVFKAGTQMFINHATRAEEAERPEGDWHKLIGATTSDAAYSESGPQGPGLYATAKFASDIAPAIMERAKLGAGLSIRANGRQAMEAGRPVMKDGVPVLGEFTGVESIDVVTKAGAGGMILTESATAGKGNEATMTQEQINQLREAGRLALNETARRHAQTVLADVSLADAGKQEAVRRALVNIPTKDGLLDEAAFTESVKAEASAVGAFVASLMPQGVRGMGAAPIQMTEKELKAKRKETERLQEARVNVFADIMGDQTAATFAAKGRAA